MIDIIYIIYIYLCVSVCVLVGVRVYCFTIKTGVVLFSLHDKTTKQEKTEN